MELRLQIHLYEPVISGYYDIPLFTSVLCLMPYLVFIMPFRRCFKHIK